MNKAVFLDRDGVINVERGEYISRIENFEVLPFAAGYIRKLHEKGYKVIVITNQGGIAKSLYTKESLRSMHAKMMEETGGLIDEVFYCPHHPDFGKCLCRKPDSLMIEKAIAKYHIDPNESIFIGDKQRDMDAASGAGVKGFLIDENQDWGFVVDQLIKN